MAIMELFALGLLIWIIRYECSCVSVQLLIVITFKLLAVGQLLAK